MHTNNSRKITSRGLIRELVLADVYIRRRSAQAPADSRKRSHPCLVAIKNPQSVRTRGLKNGASEEVRTLDIHLGKVVLYQLSYARFLEEVAENYKFAPAVNVFLKKWPKSRKIEKSLILPSKIKLL